MRSALLLLMAFLSLSAFGQFAYFGAGVNYSYIDFKKTSESGSIKYHNLNLPISFGVRPIREIELSVSTNLNFWQKSEYEKDGDFNWVDAFSWGGRYSADQYDYQVDRQVNYNFSIKYFFEEEYNSYVELGISSQSFEETFTFVRAYRPPEFYSSGNPRYPELSSVNIRENISSNITMPTLAFGLKPHVSDKMYIDYKVALALPNYGNQNFNHRVVVDHNSTFSDTFIFDYTTFDRVLVDTQIIFSTEFGLGFFF